MPKTKSKQTGTTQSSTPTTALDPTSKMATRGVTKTGARPAEPKSEIQASSAREKSAGIVNSSTTMTPVFSDKQSLLVDLVCSNFQSDRHVEDNRNLTEQVNTTVELFTNPSKQTIICSQEQSSGMHTEAPAHSIPPPPPLELDVNNADSSSIAKAIYSLQSTMMYNHHIHEHKFALKMTQIYEQMSNLNDKLQRQDEALRGLSANMANRSQLWGLEEALTKVASQADEKFIDINTDITELKMAVSHLRVDNIRLEQRLFQAEEQLSVQDIRAKKLNLTIDGIPETDKKKANLKALIVEKVNSKAPV